MPRIPVRVEPYSSPQRKQRHFKNKRDQILRALGKASYINGSHFAILWVNSRGETEHYASEVFQSKLGVWFNHDVVSQARQMVASATDAQSSHDSGLTQIAENEDDDCPINAEEEDCLEADDAVPNSMITWDQEPEIDDKSVCQRLIANNGQYPMINYNLASLKSRMHAPELRRTFSMPNPLQARNQSLPDVPTLKTFQAHNRPQALDLKRLHDEHGFHMPQGPPNSSNPEYRALAIGDSEEVTAFLETRFRQLQQLVCKIVAKAWIKVIEPKKQTRYPYNKGEDSKPTWWPDDVRHKEPDHLMKPERITLLMTMLRCGKVPTNRLELATAEVAAFIPPDKINLLREIYRVGREEERFRCNEIPGDTRIFVAATASINSAGLEELTSPSTAGLQSATGGDGPRSANIHDVHMALQRSTSNQTPMYDDVDPFAEPVDVHQGYSLLASHNAYYHGPEQQGYTPHLDGVVMNSSSQQGMPAQHFQQVQQQQIYSAQNAQARHHSAQVGPGPLQHQYAHNAWTNNVDHQQVWPQSPPHTAAFQQTTLEQQMHQSQHLQASNSQQAFFLPTSRPLETPAKQTTRDRQDPQNLRSSPYLPTPLRPDQNFSSQRGNQGVSFSDYLQSPQIGGLGAPGVLTEEDLQAADDMDEEYQ